MIWRIKLLHAVTLQKGARLCAERIITRACGLAQHLPNTAMSIPSAGGDDHALLKRLQYRGYFRQRTFGINGVRPVSCLVRLVRKPRS